MRPIDLERQGGDRGALGLHLAEFGSLGLLMGVAAEVAEELGRSPGAVHLLRSRAHDRLFELLRDT